MNRQQQGLKEPIIQLIEKYLNNQAMSGGFGLSLSSNTNNGNGNEKKDIDHTHIFESDEPGLLKPVVLDWDGTQLKKVVCGQGELKLTIELIYNDKKQVTHVETTYPDGKKIVDTLKFQFQNAEQRGKLLKVL